MTWKQPLGISTYRLESELLVSYDSLCSVLFRLAKDHSDPRNSLGPEQEARRLGRCDAGNESDLSGTTSNPSHSTRGGPKSLLDVHIDRAGDYVVSLFIT